MIAVLFTLALLAAFALGWVARGHHQPRQRRGTIDLTRRRPW